MRLCIPLVLVIAADALALSFQAGSLSGVMTQPSSSYYHYALGGFLSVESEEKRLLFRLQHWERPAFVAEGFTDQDLGQSAMVGSKLSVSSTHGVFAYFGWTRVFGYIKSDTSSNAIEDGGQRRDYSLRGPTMLAAYRIDLASFALALSHQLSVALGDSLQTEAKVVWPYSFNWLELSYSW